MSKKATSHKTQPTFIRQPKDFEYPSVKIDSKKFAELKKRVSFIETTNFDKLYFIPTAGEDHWRIGIENTALIYAYLIQKSLKREIRIHLDERGTKPHSKYGLVRIRGTTAVRKRLMKLKLYNGEQFYEGAVIFRLNKTLTQQHINQFWEEEQERRDAVNHILPVIFQDPILYSSLMSVNRRAYYAAKQQIGKFSRSDIGENIAQQILTLSKLLFTLYNTVSSSQRIEIYAKMRDLTIDLIHSWQIIAALNIWNSSKCLPLVKDYEKVVRILDDRLIRGEPPQKCSR